MNNKFKMYLFFCCPLETILSKNINPTIVKIIPILIPGGVYFNLMILFPLIKGTQIKKSSNLCNLIFSPFKVHSHPSSAKIIPYYPDRILVQ